MNKRFSVWIGFDPREADAFAVARATIARHLDPALQIPIRGIVLEDLRSRGFYTRETTYRLPEDDDGNVIPDATPQMWDTISDAPMSTEFAISRFLTPTLAKEADQRDGWAMFLDCDMLVRGDVFEAFAGLNPTKAVYCVKHSHVPDRRTKMDGQLQTTYRRKNWSSVMLFNLEHPKNASLTPTLVNSVPGRDLHRFCWLDDEEIGELSPRCNWLVGHSPLDIDPLIVHFTDGYPRMAGYEAGPFADEWHRELNRWASGDS